MNSPHIPVLLLEIINSFKDVKNGVILDCTLGFGGHSQAILNLNPNLKVIACDRDDYALKFCKKKFQNENRIEIYKSKFSKILDKIDTKEIRGIIADIGLSSFQLDIDSRGFNKTSSTIDMRMDTKDNFSAKELINSYSKSDLEKIFSKFAELPNAKDIAEKIIIAREKSKIESAKDLLKIIGTKNLNNRKISISTLVFQAIRIEINKELEELQTLLKKVKNSKIDNAVFSIISFHSLEDRIIKSSFKEWEKSCICDDLAMKCTCSNNHSIGKIFTKKPITPSIAEIKQNPRSSCSKMRIFHIQRKS